MKKITFIICVSMFFGAALTGQNNTFPSTGNAGIGTTSPGAPLHMVVDGETGATAWFERIANNINGPALLMRKARGTAASKVKAANGDVAGGLFAQVYDGTGYKPAATVRFFVDGNITGSSSPGMVAFQTQAVGGNTNGALKNRLVVRSNGNVGIGTDNPQSHLSVKGKIESQEIQVVANVADYIFYDDYKLLDLETLEVFINENGFLPGIQNQRDVDNNRGMVKLGELSISLMEKVEELTLHLIEMNKRVKKLEMENMKLTNQINK